MIGYTVLGTNDLARSAAFYDDLLGLLGGKRLMQEQDFIVWSFSDEASHFSIHKPFDGKAASQGNGVMIALKAESPDQVNKIYQRALTIGAKDEGAPGPRSEDGHLYAAYFRDLDGNKLNVHCLS